MTPLFIPPLSSITHEPRLVWRYHVQTLLRHLTWTALPLTGLALGRALGYVGPAAFSYRPFKGRITLAPPRSLFLWRRIEVIVSGQAGQPG